MNKTQASDRIHKLRDLINEYRYEYHVNNRSIMSEAAADGLKHELAELEGEFPDLVTPDSPTQRVAGEPLPQFVSAEHKYPMLSLNDVFDQGEVSAWEARIQKLVPGQKLEYFADIKMDGLACSLVYQNGILVRALTRGNGRVGEDVTANLRTLESVPLKLNKSAQTTTFEQGYTEVRGEIVMYKSDFEALNEQRAKAGLPLFANPRNLAAGTVRQLDPKLVVGRPLKFRAWDLRRDDSSEVPTNEFCYEILAKLGFLVNDQAELVGSVTDVMKFAKKWEEKRLRLPFNTDGLVVKVNDRAVFEKLGVVGKAPRGAVAYKYPAEQATTKVKDIFVSIGRTGAATPVAVLEPVVVAGSTVQMATLHNEGEVKRKDVRVGDTVIIHKAGDIIPEVVEVLKTLRTGKEQPFEMPKKCPECGSDLKKEDAEAVWRCLNYACPARVHNQIQHYTSKSALDIEGMGEKNVLALLDANLIRDPADLYTLTKDQLLKLDRFAEISASKLIDAIAVKKHPSLSHFIYALGIRHVGAQTAVDLSNKFGNLDSLSSATIDELRQVEGVGEVVAESIMTWFASAQNQQLLAKFANAGVEPMEVKRVNGGKLQGLGFVVSGTLETMEREQAGDKIRQLGGTFQSSVGKNTDYLVLGENPGASKVAKAEKLGTRIIDEKMLLKMLQ
ncbi:MAG TPA: NAD-dependent DNA ligase LigA [Candidatus Saccharimonadales bacterium]|nr:NAD-dependent DNA ligase LigA [Candidatus Saccharimonadales bacterium]